MGKRRGSISVFKEDTTPITIYLPQSIVSELKAFIQSKYNSLPRGAMSYEIARAIEEYLKRANSKKKANLRVPKFMRVYNEVKDVLRRMKGGDVRIASRADLAYAISVVRGSHPQTITNWIGIFLRMRLIKPVGIERYELS